MSDKPLAGQADRTAKASVAPAVDPFATFEVPTNGVVLELSDVSLDGPVAPAPPVQKSPTPETVAPKETTASKTPPSPVLEDATVNAPPVQEQTVAAKPIPASIVEAEPVTAKAPEAAAEPPSIKRPTAQTSPAAVSPPMAEPDPVMMPPAVTTKPAAAETKTQPKPQQMAPPKSDAAETKIKTSPTPVPTVVYTPERPAPQPKPVQRPQPAAKQPAAPQPAPVAEVKPTPAPTPVAAIPVEPIPAAIPDAPTAPVPTAAPMADAVAAEQTPATFFGGLNLRPEIQAAIERGGYTTPTEIQAQIIPHMLEGRDVLAQSQTGTGKTAAFALPILSRIDLNNRRPQILVLAPTRELAIQVGRSFETYGADLDRLNVATIYGGSDYYPQLKALKQGAQVVVGTPGRTIDHINRGTLKLDGITCLALDEADEMLNMGFLEDVQFVLEHTPDDRQVALFSATMPGPIRDIAQQYLNNPARITVKAKTMTAASIRQRAVIAQPRFKVDALLRFLEFEDSDGAIVFTKTRESTVSVADSLIQNGLKAVALNGDMPQKVRERTIEQLKSGRLDVLVATDVAARGLDVSRISHVFNFDVPQDNESYIHRIGRTGRAGRKGEAIIFLSKSQRYKLRQIERATRQPIEVVDPPTAEQLNAKRVEQFKKQITEVMEGTDLAFFHKMITELASESDKPVDYIAAALAHLGQGGRPFFVEDRPQRASFSSDDRQDRDRGRRERGQDGDRRGGRERFSRERDGGGRGPRQLSTPEPGMERFRIEVGRRDGVKPGNIVGAVANEGGLDGSQIGPIAIHDSHSTVDLPSGMPSEVFQTLRQTKVAGKPLRLRRNTEESTDSDSSDNRHSSGKRFGGKRQGHKPRSGGPSRFGGKGKFRKRRQGGDRND